MLEDMAVGFATVGQQVLILFLLVAVGFACGKARVLDSRAVKGIAELVLLFAAPCVIIQSFERPFRPSMLVGLGIAALAAVVVHIVSILIARLVFRDAEVARRRVLRFATVFSNAGYMGLPLQQALLGEDGVFYGAAYVVVFNLVLWSYGLFEMSGDSKGFSVRKLLLNPGIIGIVCGLPLFLFSLTLPTVLSEPVRHIASLNTPLPMICIGFYLADTRLREALRDKKSYVVAGLRLLAIPLLALGALYLCGIRGALLVSLVIAASAPCAAATTMFATKFDQDTALSVNLVSLTTILSLATMPLVVGLAQAIA